MEQQRNKRVVLSVFEPRFEHGKRYHYKYVADVVTTVQGYEMGRSVVRLTGGLDIYGGDQENILKIASLKVEDAVGIFPGEPPFAAPSRQPESLIACTKYSFVFGYVNGKVQNIRVPRDPPLPCVNLVRGFLNGFSMSIKNQKEYELQEDGIGGECHTRYVIRDDRRSSTVLVSRTKDSNNCRNKMERSIGTFFIHRNPNCLLQNRVIQGTEAFTFKLKYNPSGANAQIMQVDAEQVYQLSPFSGAEGAGVMKAT
ncbi:vitellogenin-2-like [Lacerta agilis]|uniref:vitellogenin-2-like n=1 Tax=Lacerta agilis TaxID=80427 RepID=UPI00141A5620|nr:vitellogenin-2-like [Lacerta agilis]